MTVNIEAIEVMAAKAGLANWIIEGSADKGWYTCVLTGKKMRSAAAEEQLAKQAEYTATLVPQSADEIVIEPEAPTAGGMVNSVDKALAADAVIAQVEAAGGDAGVLGRSAYDSYVFGMTGMSARLFEHTAGGMAMADKKIIAINCTDCGTERKIKVQDQFQVTRCVDCQKVHRNRVRAERRKAKNEQAKQQ